VPNSKVLGARSLDDKATRALSTPVRAGLARRALLLLQVGTVKRAYTAMRATLRVALHHLLQHELVALA